MIPTCLICKNKKNVKFIDKYKFHVESDIKFFGNLKIYGCESCELYFVDPMPNINKLNYFYEKIYRAKGRPHFYFKDIENEYCNEKNLNHIAYLTKFIDFKKINNILDFGTGIGDLGYLIKKKFKHINLHCCENDSYSLKILKKRDYSNYKNIDQINKKFDLIISLHALEHLTDLNHFFNLTKLLNSNGKFFFEVPNCPFKNFYIDRPYDSPHCFFFTKKSWEKIIKLGKLKTINLSYSSWSIKKTFLNMEQSKKKHRNWELNKIDFNLKNIIRNYIPNFIFKIRRNLNKLSKYDLNQPNLFNNSREDSWCIRGLIKK